MTSKIKCSRVHPLFLVVKNTIFKTNTSEIHFQLDTVMLKMRTHPVPQAGPELLPSSDHLAFASQ